MRLLLLRPNSRSFSAVPPIGLLSLASYIHHHSHHAVSIFDGLVKNSSDRDIIKIVSELKPEVVGISGMTIDRLGCHHTAALIKRAFPHIKIVIGGAYVTSDPVNAFENLAFDYAVLGEGEIAALNLLNTLEDNGNLDTLPGIACRKNGSLSQISRAEFIKDLNSLPIKAWDLIDLNDYFYNKKRPSTLNLHIKSRRNVPLFTSRGCPFACSFCHNMFGQKFRSLSPENVISEIVYLKERWDVEEFEIVDDIFNYNVNRAMKIARGIIDLGLKLNFSFPNGLRADLMTKELVDLLHKMGTYRICYAVETASPDTQKEIGKRINMEKSRQIIEYTADKNISVGVSYILGFPGETEDQARQTIDLAMTFKSSTASFFYLNPYPGTKIHALAVKQNRNDSEYSLVHYYKLGINVSNIESAKLKSLFSYAYRRYYLHPMRLYRFLKTTPILIFFFRKLLIILIFFFTKLHQEKKAEVDDSILRHWQRPVIS